MQGDDVEVALDDDDLTALADGIAGGVQTVQVIALAIEGRLRRVDVLGAGFVGGGTWVGARQNSATEGHDIAQRGRSPPTHRH
jgi:hypothetical protein